MVQCSSLCVDNERDEHRVVRAVVRSRPSHERFETVSPETTRGRFESRPLPLGFFPEERKRFEAYGGSPSPRRVARLALHAETTRGRVRGVCVPATPRDGEGDERARLGDEDRRRGEECIAPPGAFFDFVFFAGLPSNSFLISSALLSTALMIS